jgi:hypothetical protein
MKNIFVHMLRGISYLSFPVGVFLFAVFILSALDHDLDFSTTINVLLNVSAFLLFFIPPLIILFLHPSPASNAATEEKGDSSKLANNTHYLPHVAIIAILAALVLAPLFLLLTFLLVTLGLG